MKNFNYFLLIGLILTLSFCQYNTKPLQKGSFGYDLKFLEKYKEIVVLKDVSEKSQVVIVPDYQARVMTSTSDGSYGQSYGWINYKLIASGKFQEHINAFGGENRFWIGPEGGQYSVFFKPNTSFEIPNWYTPKPIDTEKFNLVNHSRYKACFTKKMSLTNYSNYTFDIQVDREVMILNKTQIQDYLDLQLDEKVSCVAYTTKDALKNIGKKQWKKQTGLLSIWILGMFVPSDKTMIIIPYKDSLAINTNYFGTIGEDRLKVENNKILFKGDGKYRCKIGLPPQNIIPIAGSYDPLHQTLTIVQYTFDSSNNCYVNSLWQHQENPYAGDVFNSYNDGPMKDGTLIGPFYELESSCASLELKVGESMKHEHTTYHFKGDFKELNNIAKQLLFTSLKDVSIK